MHRFYLPPDQCREPTIQLSERDAKHAIKVLRLRDQDRFSVLDGEGHELLCQTEQITKTAVSGRVLSLNKLPALPYELTLIQAVTKGKSMDLIVQKATELGCRTIIPVMSERTVVQCDDEEASAKQEKWQTVAVEAIKQCGQAWLPRVEKPVSLNAALPSQSPSAAPFSLIASLQPGAVHPRVPIEQYRQEHGQLPKQLSVWIGPEGDFTPAECNAIKGSGALPITLGSLILRSETAAIYALSVLNYELQSPS